MRTIEGDDSRDIEWDLGLLPIRLAVDANVLIRAIEARAPSRASDPEALICESLYELAVAGRVTLVIPTPVIAEWWIGAPDAKIPEGKALELVPFGIKAARMMAGYVGRKGLTEAAAKGLPKRYLKFDAMVLACVWAAGVDTLVTSDEDDFRALLSLESVPTDKKLRVMTPTALHARFGSHDAGQLPLFGGAGPGKK